MRNALATLASGTLFGAGLALSGMTNPQKVLNFLDVAGRWDPSLALVMLGAVSVSALGYRLARSRARPLAGGTFPSLPASGVDARLLGGAALFGLGWGVAGLCPGPAIANLLAGSPPLLAFLAAMLAGMALSRWWPGR